MSDNPYAPPETNVGPLRGGPFTGSPRDWEYGELLTEAWEAFKRDWPVVLGSWIAVILIGVAVNTLLQRLLGGSATDDSPRLLTRALQQSPPDFTVVTNVLAQQFSRSIPVSLLGNLLTGFLSVGLIRILLASARGESPQFGELFNGFSRYPQYLAVYLILAVAVLLGLAMCVFPAVIAWVALQPAIYFVCDTELGPLECVRASLAATEGQRWKIFGFFLVVVLITLAGYFACCVGILVTAPVGMLAMAVLYLRLSGRGSSGGLEGAEPPTSPAGFV